MKKIMYAVLGMVLFASCNKEESSEIVLEEKKAPQFEVTTEKITYMVGEQVTFNIEGDAGVLDFWSGEIGNDYDYKIVNRFLPAPDDILLQFRIRHQYKTSRVYGTLQVLVSTDFDGDRLSFDEVDAATWTDITDRFDDFNEDALTWTGPPPPPGTNLVPSPINITDLREEGKPMYIALKYIYDGPGTAGSWGLIDQIVVEAVAEDGTVLLSGPLSSDFPAYGAVSPDKNPIRSLNRYYDPEGLYPTSNLLVIQSNANATVGGVQYFANSYTEEYFVSVPYNVGPQDLGPDQPVTVTRLNRPTISSLTHEYSTPGMYKVRFVGTDPSLKENNQTIRELEIIIVPDE